jgi:hypothetical protein
MDIEAITAEAPAAVERRQRENAKRRPKTPEDKARDAVKARLRVCGRGIEALAADLERVHSDRSGGYRAATLWLPLYEERMRGPPTRPRLLDQFERIEREAAAGCELSAAFVAEYGELLRLCDHLRYERPPPRAADYDPLESLTPEQRRRIREAG